MDDKARVKIRPREEDLHNKWANLADYVPVNNQQHSFDSIQRQEDFISSLFQTKEDLERYRYYRSEWYRRAKELDPADAPLAVCCELVSSCNLNCPMCYSATEEFQASVVGVQRQMPWDVAKSIIDECAEIGVFSMLFSWRGEPTLYCSKDQEGKKVTFPDILSYARKKGILEITALTNGQMLDEHMAKAIVEAEPSWISISIDGLRENYNKIRTPLHKKGASYDAFNQVVEGIKMICKFRDAHGKRRPQVRSNTIYPPIADDPMAYHEYLKNIGVGWITVNEILDFRGESLPDDAIIKKWACQYPFQRLTISANGSIIPCTGAHNEEREMLLGRYPGSQLKRVTKDGKGETVELPERRIREVWHSQELERIRDTHRKFERREIAACRNCRHGALKHGVEWIPDEWDMVMMEWRGRQWKE